MNNFVLIWGKEINHAIYDGVWWEGSCVTSTWTLLKETTLISKIISSGVSFLYSSTSTLYVACLFFLSLHHVISIFYNFE